MSSATMASIQCMAVMGCLQSIDIMQQLVHLLERQQFLTTTARARMYTTSLMQPVMVMELFGCHLSTHLPLMHTSLSGP